MKSVFMICKRELFSIFSRPVALIVTVFFLLLNGVFFHSSVNYHSKQDLNLLKLEYYFDDYGLMSMVFKPLADNIIVIFLFIVPLITMRLIAGEKKNGSWELLNSCPVSTRSVLWGKYLSSLLFSLFLISLTLIYPVMIRRFQDIAVTEILSILMGGCLVITLFNAFGILAGSLTKNNIIAAILTFGAQLFLWVSAWAEHILPAPFGGILTSISFIQRFEDFKKGVIDSHHIVYFIGSAVLLLEVAEFLLKREES